MAIDAVVVLDTLQCLHLSDGNGRAPYVWPVLLYLDDTTLMANPLAPIFLECPVEGEARIVLAGNMQAGDTAAIPYPLGTFSVRFEDNLTTRLMALIVAVWEKRDLPDDAVIAGFDAFCSTLETVVNANLSGLSDPATRTPTIENVIKPQVHDAVYSAIRNKLGGPWFFLHSMDTFVDVSYLQLPINVSDITLNIPDPPALSSDSYVVHGAIQLLEPTIDLCQNEVDAVNNAQDTVTQINAQLQDLDAEWEHASPAMRRYILAQRRQLGDTLGHLQAKLLEAPKALRACREHWAAVGAIVGGIRAGPGARQ